MTKLQDPPPQALWRSTKTVALLAAAVAVGFYLFSEHQGHLYGVWPYLFLLACPFMHLLMHRGHGHGGHRHNEAHRKSSVNDERT